MCAFQSAKVIYSLSPQSVSLMGVISPKSGFPIVKIAIGLTVLSVILTAYVALKLRQQQCVSVVVPIDLKISLGQGCPRFPTNLVVPKRP